MVIIFEKLERMRNGTFCNFFDRYSQIALLLSHNVSKAFVILLLLTQLDAFGQTNEYLFDNSFNETGGGPALTEALNNCGASSGSFGTISAGVSGNCQSFNAFRFNAGGGLRYNNPGLITGTYSISMFFSMSNYGGYRRVLDFTNGIADKGLYMNNGCLEFWQGCGTVGQCPSFYPNCFYLLTITRNGANKNMSVYVNGNLLGSCVDASDLCVLPSSNTPLYFFTNGAACFHSAGKIAYLSITPTVLTAIDAAQLWSNIGTLAQTSPAPPPVVSVSPSAAALTCSTTSITLTANGGGTYVWGSGATTSSISVNVPNTYSVTVTDVNCCSATTSSVITQNITPPMAAISPSTGTLNCSTISIPLTASGGGTYNWGGGITSATKTVNTPNTYTVTVTGTNGCTATASSIISQSLVPPVASVSPSSGAITCLSPTIALTASGGGTYNWGGGITTSVNTVNSTNTYTVTVTATNGCTATASSVISQNVTPPIASINPTSFSLTCTTPSTTLTASGVGTYDWGGGVTTATNTVNTPSTYTVTVTGANGCTATASSAVTQNVTSPIVSVSPTNFVLTCANPSTTLTASGGGTYNWGGGITTANTTVNTVGTYTVTITAANGCTATASSVVTQNFTPPSVAVSPASFLLTCTNPSVTLTASGGGTYNWGGGITTATNTINSPNTYTVTVTDANGCTASASSIVTQDVTLPSPTITPASTTLTCSNPSVNLTASGGGSYNWGGGINTAINTVNSPNTYTVTVTAANGCTATASSVVTQNITPPIASVNPANATLTCANPSVTLTANGGGTYNWGGGITTAANTVNSPNTYTVTVTDLNGCTATASATVNQSNTPPVVSISPASATLTCTSPSTALTANGTGTFNWGSGITTATNLVNSAGTYTVTITDANGCTASASAVVSQNTTPPAATVTPSSGTLTCTTLSVGLTAGGGTSYDWGGGIVTSVNTVILPNTYTVTVTGANGCTATASALVNQDITPPVAAIAPASATLTCVTSSITLTASGGGTYDWGGSITTVANTINSPNTYTVTVTAANGCTATASSVVAQSVTVPPAAISPASFTIDCNTPSTTLTASGGISYNWGGGVTTATNTISSPNTYTVTVTDVNGCTGTASSVISQDIAPPVASVVPASAALNCITSSVVLTAGGGGTYDWGGGIVTATNTVNSANTYSVTVTGTNGCTATASSVVTDDFTPPPATVTPSSGTLTCTTLSVGLTAGGGTSYDWGGGIATSVNTVSLPNTYTVTVTGANGCSATASALVNQDITPPVAAVAPASATLTCVTTSVTLTASGGGTYDWGGSITTVANTINSPNTYTVTVTAANGCTSTASSVVAQSVTVPPAAISPASFTIDCNTPSTTLTASGGISYNWGGGVTTATNTISSPNTYTVTVTDVNGCTGTASSVISQDIAPPVASVVPASAALNCITSSVVLTAGGSGTYDWGGGIATATNTVNSANTYTVTVTGANGCTATASSIVTDDFTPPPATVTPSSGTLTCTTLSVGLTAGGGTSYDWGGGIVTSVNTVNLPNTYTVTVTGANGCTATASALVNQDITPPVASISPSTAVLTCETPSATLTASGGGTYDWGGGIITAINSVSSPNTYTVTVTAANGCTASASLGVTQDIVQPNVAIAPGVMLTCAVLNSTLTASSTTPNAEFDWGGGVTTASKTVSSPGTYTVTVTDPVNGCTISSSENVTQDIVAPNITLTNTGILSCINASVAIDASSTTPNVTYDWGAGNTTTSNTVSSAGSYVVTVTDPSNSCTATASNTVQQNTTPPPVSIAPSATLNCINASVTLSASSSVANATYDWGGGNNTPTNTVSIPAAYGLTVTDPGNGCTSSLSVNVNQNLTIPNVTIAPPGKITCHTPNVTLSASSTALIPSYDWGGGNTASTYTVSVPNTYPVTVTDIDNGCSATATADVTDVPLMVLSETHTNVTCFSFIDGAIDLTVTGGQSPFTYLWSNNDTNEDISGIAAGSYSVIVTDGINCTTSISVPITEPANIAVSETHVNVSCNGANDGSIDVTVSGGNPPYTFSWNDANANEDRTGLAPANYTVTVTYNNTCTTSISASITEPAAISLQPVINNPTCATHGNDGNIDVTANGGSLPFSFLWSNGTTVSNYPNAGEGSYSLTVTDANGCSITDTYVLNYLYDFVVDASPFVTINLGESILLNYTLTGNTGVYTSQWTPAYGLGCTDCVSTEASPVYSTLYNITIENEVGCVSSDTVTIQVIPKYDVFVPNVFTPNGDNVNDLFEVFGKINGVEYLEIQIFNRLGEKVFESSNHQFKWDGSYKGESLAPQIFTWQMRLTWLNGHRDELRRGTLTLMK